MNNRKTPFASAGNLLILIWFTLAMWVLIILPKGEVVLWLNARHNAFWDQAMVAWTFLGDGWAFAIALVVVALVRFYHILPLLVAVVIQTVLVHLGKRVLFPGALRPKGWFDADTPLQFVEGIKVHLANSFPSGHTATGFTLAFLVMLLHRKALSSALALMLAIGVGVSRMYLVLHFWEDVFAGSLVALVAVLLSWAICYRKEPVWAQRGFWGRRTIRLR